MRKGRRQKEEGRLKKSIYLYVVILLALILTTIITFVVYNNKLNESFKSSLTTEELTGLIPSISTTDIAKTSSEISKTIEEAMENNGEENRVIESTIQNDVATDIKPETIETKKEEIIEEVIILDPEFIIPVEGEIVKEYAKDNLIFSETLQEWITHNGIDIKADRTSVVKSAENGKVIAIKNDPRYGLTIIVEHVNNFKTVYSNLLTTEFVSEGEEVTKGQSLGTVGNSAIFEIADVPHLHFEILKDDISIDPTIYLK